MIPNIPKPLTQGLTPSRPWQGASLAVRIVHSARLACRLLIYRAVSFFLLHLLIPNLIFSMLRRFRPVATIGNTLFVTKGDHVREVLTRFADFTLGDVIEPGMPWGSFLM